MAMATTRITTILHAIARPQPRRFASTATFPGTHMPLTPTLVFRDPLEDKPLPCFRLVDEKGEIVRGAQDPELGRDLMMQLYKHMVRMNTMDHVLYDAQRQGRISFYATSLGEEAVHFGTASALPLRDMVFGQYREPGVLMWRGYTVQDFADQCCGNVEGHGVGRQTPMHYGSKELNYQTIASPLATQMPHAVGAAYGFKLAKEDRIALCFFGDGAASEGDAHAALNFAATRECPVLFVCRNNGFAISTPTSEQYCGDGIASRGAAYGIPVMRVDGNDVIAVHVVTKFAREFIRKHNRPVLIEAMTYRQGHHSTSDDSTLYRDAAEIKKWAEEHDPIDRTRRYLMRKGWLTEEQDEALHLDERAGVLQALGAAEKKPMPGLDTMFEDVFDQKLWHLKEQEQELQEHIAKYPEQYAGLH